MLAEPKRKTVWSSNPRGKYWSEDKNKFGQKLLESMGWKEGMGLGRDTNGITQNIKVGVNCESRGLGYKPTGEVWIDKNADYERLLADLAVHHNNGSPKKQIAVSNLEEVSKKFKNKLTYHKLIRSKNLSQCSQKDLNSIFPKTSKSVKNETNAANNSIESTNDDNQSVNTYESSKNINEYFKSKLDKLKIKCHLFDNSLTNSDTKDEPQPEVLTIEGTTDDSPNKRSVEDEEQESVLEFNCNQMESDVKEMKKSKKHKKRKLNDEMDCVVNNGNDRSETNEMIAKKSKKKKRQRSECESVQHLLGLSSDCSNSSSEVSNKNVETKQDFEVRVPKGYLKSSFSVCESLKKHKQICLAISRDKVLSTSNWTAIKGYGSHSD